MTTMIVVGGAIIACGFGGVVRWLVCEFVAII